ncbi:hypothetical protein TNCV_3217721 [Trichonephila clavipes]|nr:hypothetical protein TNCV_3217721 [Trichonephila clavipes]
MKKEKRNTYRCGQRTVRLAVVACSQKPSSLRAQAQLMRTETVETFELVKVEPKLLREEKRERERFEPGKCRFKKQRLNQPCHAFLRISFYLYWWFLLTKAQHPRVSLGLVKMPFPEASLLPASVLQFLVPQTRSSFLGHQSI